MEIPEPMHPKAVRPFLPIVLFVAGVLANLSLCAQKPQYVKVQELQYDYQKRLTKLRATNQPYTGYEYSLYGYNQKQDTIQLRYFTNGALDWSKSYSYQGKLTSFHINYNHGLKDDSICMERVSFDQYWGDTIGYEIQYIDKKGVKWYKQYTYYQSYQQYPHKDPALMAVRTMRFFTKSDTRSFTEAQYKKAENFDSAGYHTTYAETGRYVEYHENGKVRTEGQQAAYEFRVSHKGQYPSYPTYGKTGTWKYYNQDGIKSREEIYDLNSQVIGTTTFYANGEPMNKTNFKVMGSEIVMPFSEGITIKRRDTCLIVHATWTQDGKKAYEQIKTPNGDVITYAYHPNGKPAYLMAITSARKPYGINKKWDGQGNVTEFINYNIETNDTLSYVAVNGKIQRLNLRDRSVSMQWELMPVDYYGNEAKKHLFNQTVVYKEFHANGRMKTEVNLKRGKRDGAYVEWDSLGTQCVRAYYKNDIPDGPWNEWYPNAKLKKVFSYTNGIRDGKCTEYYYDGGIKWENTYNNGVPGQPTAYAENGTVLNSKKYLTAFYSATCLSAQVKSYQTTTLHYYLTDTTVSRSYVTLPDSALNGYAMKVLATLGAVDPGYDYCAPVKQVRNDNNEFDLYHSCFAISASLYTEKNKQVINNFFARNGIKTDKTKESDNPVLGLEKEYLIYYSSDKILNKQIVIDSLELYLAPHANDPKQGYLMSVDLNYPKGELFGSGTETSIISSKGYSTFSVERKAYTYPSFVNTPTTSYYIVYDDLTCDFQYTSYGVPMMTYWALK